MLSVVIRALCRLSCLKNYRGLQTVSLYEIEPFLQGDPFSDPQILDRLEYIRGHLPDTRLRLYTNAYGLNERKADRLASIGLDDLTISINTLDSALRGNDGHSARSNSRKRRVLVVR